MNEQKSRFVGKKFQLRLEANEAYRDGSRQGEEEDTSRDNRWWHGIGELTDLQTGEKNIFRFETAWAGPQGRSLIDSIFCFTNGSGDFIGEEIAVVDDKLKIDFVCNRISKYFAIPSDNPGDILPSISISPIERKDAIHAGIILEESGQRQMALT